MTLKFKYKRFSYSYTMKNDIIKIYSVPREYSGDELYIADYSPTSIEPFPSSEGSKTKLIYHASKRNVMGTTHIEVLTNNIGDIEYA